MAETTGEARCMRFVAKCLKERAEALRENVMAAVDLLDDCGCRDALLDAWHELDSAVGGLEYACLKPMVVLDVETLGDEEADHVA